MARGLNLEGQRFGKLEVVSKAENSYDACGTLRTQWVCKCDCGKVFTTKTRYLRRGTVKNCGCRKLNYKEFWAK